jgi:hypothetical protein
MEVWLPLKSIFLFIIISLSLSSCDVYSFSMPQPVDKENIKTFPNQFLGAWIDEDSTITFLVNKANVSMIQTHDEKVVVGAWPKPGKNGAYIYTPHFYKSMETIHYDSSKNPIDTIAKYLLRRDKVYEKTVDGFLKNGFPYRQDKDTLIISVKDTVSIDLGKNAFLRQLNKNIYAFNFIQNSLNEHTTWWEVTLLEIKDDKTIYLWDVTSKVKNLPCMFYSNNGSNYLDCQFTTAEMIGLMKDSTFEVSDPLHKMKIL